MNHIEVLNAWLLDNPTAPEHCRQIAKKLANREDPEAAAAWETLIARGAEPMQLLAMVSDAWLAATDDWFRARPKDELRSLEKVASLTHQLMIELQGCPALDAPALGNIDGAETWLAFTRNGASILAGSEVLDFPRFAITEALQALKDRCDYLRGRGLLNSIERGTGGQDKSLHRGFSRHLAARFMADFQDTMPATIARLANVVHRSERDPCDAKQVAGFLENK